MAAMSGGCYISILVGTIFMCAINIAGGFRLDTSSYATTESTNSSKEYHPMMFAEIKECSYEMPVPGGQFKYEYKVTNNDVQTRSYNISVKVDNYMLNAKVKKTHFSVGARQTRAGTISILVDHKARPGLERKVQMIITDEFGRVKQFKRYLVIREEPIAHDGNPPELIFLSFITACQNDAKFRTPCGKGNWTVLFSVQDIDSGLSIIDVDDHRISTVWTEDYAPGQVIRPINCKVSTDCCQKRTVIIVSDNNGNTIRIPIVFPRNSTLTQPNHKNDKPPKVTAMVVSGFAGCLLLVIICTVIVYNWNKIQTNKTKETSKDDIGMHPRPTKERF